VGFIRFKWLDTRVFRTSGIAPSTLVYLDPFPVNLIRSKWLVVLSRLAVG